MSRSKEKRDQKVTYSRQVSPLLMSRTTVLVRYWLHYLGKHSMKVILSLTKEGKLSIRQDH